MELSLELGFKGDEGKYRCLGLAGVQLADHQDTKIKLGPLAEYAGVTFKQQSVVEPGKQLIVAENALNSQGFSSTEVPSAFAQKDFAKSSPRYMHRWPWRRMA